jgi:hypothetical protein
VHQCTIADDESFGEIDIVLIQNFGKLFNRQLFVTQVRKRGDPLDTVVRNNINTPEFIQKVVRPKVFSRATADVKNLFDVGRDFEVIKTTSGCRIRVFVPLAKPFGEASVKLSIFKSVEKDHAAGIAAKESANVKGWR